jgi:hypothetical protein
VSNPIEYSRVMEQPAGTESARSTPRPWIAPSLRAALAVVLSLFFGAGAFWLYTRHNDFPIHYQPDEPSKADQLLDPFQRRNFNHPLLLLESAELAVKKLEVPRRPRDIVITGRWVSAVMASVGVAALALAAYHAGGFAGLLIAGPVVGLCPQLLVHAHYFKEDTALLSGIMLAMLGARLTVGAKRWWSQLLSCFVLGVGCAAAASGKYFGAVTVVPCLVAACVAPTCGGGGCCLCVALFVTVTLAVVAGINWRMFRARPARQLAAPLAGSDRAHRRRIRACHQGPLRHRDVYPQLLLRPHRGARHDGAPVGVHRRRRRLARREGVASRVQVGVQPLGHGPRRVCADVRDRAFDAIPFARYALPLTVTLYFIAALLAADVLIDLMRWSRWGRRRCPRGLCGAGDRATGLALREVQRAVLRRHSPATARVGREEPAARRGRHRRPLHPVDQARRPVAIPEPEPIVAQRRGRHVVRSGYRGVGPRPGGSRRGLRRGGGDELAAILRAAGQGCTGLRAHFQALPRLLFRSV